MHGLCRCAVVGARIGMPTSSGFDARSDRELSVAETEVSEAVRIARAVPAEATNSRKDRGSGWWPKVARPGFLARANFNFLLLLSHSAIPVFQLTFASLSEERLLPT